VSSPRSLRVLVLDDDATRHMHFRAQLIGHIVTHVMNYDEAVAALASTRFDLAFLDHDLSDMAAAGMPREGERTGTHVAEFIAAMAPESRPIRVAVHSFNPDGARRMVNILANAGVRVSREPFKAVR